jgi:hypothetical protein
VGLALAGLVSAEAVTPPRTEPAAVAAPVAKPAPPATSPDPTALPPEETAPVKTPPPDDSAAAPSPEDKDTGDDDAKAKQAVADTAAEAPATDPAKRLNHGSAVIQAVDKITAETMRFEARIGAPVRWKGLVFTVRSCQTSAPDEPVKDAIAYLQIRSEPHAQSQEQAQAAAREVFRGWMFASSPALNPLQHPVYDAWVVACRA